MPLHGLKCERGTKILERWGFLGVRKGQNGHFDAVSLTYVNSLAELSDSLEWRVNVPPFFDGED